MVCLKGQVACKRCRTPHVPFPHMPVRFRRLCQPCNAAVTRRHMCRACNARVANRPARMCWKCFYTPGVREGLPPLDGPHRRRGHGNGNKNAPLAETPTAAPPGTAEKMQVMSHRAELGVQIFHPADARFPGDPRPRLFLRGLTG